MFKIVLVDFPFTDNPGKTKIRPALCLTKPLSRHKIVIIAFITSQIDEILETDVMLDAKIKDFYNTGLKRASLIRLHKLTSMPFENVEGEIGFVSNKCSKEIKKKLKLIFKI